MLADTGLWALGGLPEAPPQAVWAHADPLLSDVGAAGRKALLPREPLLLWGPVWDPVSLSACLREPNRRAAPA